MYHLLPLSAQRSSTPSCLLHLSRACSLARAGCHGRGRCASRPAALAEIRLPPQVARATIGGRIGHAASLATPKMARRRRPSVCTIRAPLGRVHGPTQDRHHLLRLVLARTRIIWAWQLAVLSLKGPCCCYCYSLFAWANRWKQEKHHTRKTVVHQ